MTLGELLIKLQIIEQKLSVYDDLIEYLGQDDLDIPTESGSVASDVVHEVVAELQGRKDALIAALSAVEDVGVSNEAVKALSDS